jgi:membrane fusion protein, multidrug efflux system
MNPLQRKILITSVVIVLAAAFLFFKSKWSSSTPETVKTAPAASAKPAGKVSIKVHIVRERKLEDKLSVVGSVVANEEVQLSCETAGKITKIYFEEGSMVSKGQLLLELNDADLQAQIKKAQIRKELLEKKKIRDIQLHAKKGVSDEALENLLADLETVKSEIEFIKAQIDKTKLKAPFGGQIGIRYISEGSYLTPNTKIADLVDISQVKIEFSIPEKYSGSLRKGGEIGFTLAGKTMDYTGRIYAIDPKVDASTRTLRMRAITANPKGEILPGSFASIKLNMSDIGNSKMIPTQSVIPEMDKKKVFLVKNGKAQSQAIITGIRTETQVQVLEGLNEGDSVVVSGILQLTEGANVDISEVE